VGLRVYSRAARRTVTEEAILNAKTYSRRDERRILDVLGRSLLKDFPNPERIGCPGPDVLERIASHDMPLSEAEKWLDHLGSCSPCYTDFKQLQQADASRRRRMVLAIAAGILVAVAVTGWTLFHKRTETLSAQTAVVDLRDRSIARGSEPNPSEPPLEISRRASHLNIYLPLGSSDGQYDVRILASQDRVLLSTNGSGSGQQGLTSLVVDVNLSSASRGLYVLQLRKADSGWATYPLRVK